MNDRIENKDDSSRPFWDESDNRERLQPECDPGRAKTRGMISELRPRQNISPRLANATIESEKKFNPFPAIVSIPGVVFGYGGPDVGAGPQLCQSMLKNPRPFDKKLNKVISH